MESLRRAALFKGLPDEELRALAGIVKRIKAEPGDLLFEEGDEDDRFYVVTAGAVEIVKHVPGGGEEKLAVRRAGHAFGEMALLNSAPRFATARVARECECMTLSREDFERLMGGDSFSLRMLRILSQALRALGVRFVNVERGEAGPGEGARGGGRSVRFERNAPTVDGFDVAGGSAPNRSGIELSAWEALRFSDDRSGWWRWLCREIGCRPCIRSRSLERSATSSASPGSRHRRCSPVSATVSTTTRSLPVFSSWRQGCSFRTATTCFGPTRAAFSAPSSARTVPSTSFSTMGHRSE